VVIKRIRPYATKRIISHFGFSLATKLISSNVTIYFNVLFLPGEMNVEIRGSGCIPQKRKWVLCYKNNGPSKADVSEKLN
jgi:hypothetical protein